MEGLGLGVSGSRVWGLGLRFEGWVRGLKSSSPGRWALNLGMYRGRPRKGLQDLRTHPIENLEITEV